MESAILLVGHGSRDPEAVEEFRRLLELYRHADPDRIVEGGFLEFVQPTIAEGFANCVDHGAKCIVVLPAMLLSAAHARYDIPREVRQAQERYPTAMIHLGEHLHLHPKLIEVCQLRIDEAHPQLRTRHETLLLVVGRGSREPGANADVETLARVLREEMGFGSASACHVSLSDPLLPAALQHARSMNFRRIVVFSYLLFTGVLEKQIRHIVRDFGRENADMEVIYANYLNAHPWLVDVLQERARKV